jgi:hypothetical protein
MLLRLLRIAHTGVISQYSLSLPHIKHLNKHITLYGKAPCMSLGVPGVAG